MKEKDMTFIAEIYHLVKQIEETIEKNDMGHRVLAAVMIGVIDDRDDSLDQDDEFVNMRSMYSFNIQSREELDVIKDVMDSVYDEDPDLDDLLSGLGISMN